MTINITQFQLKMLYLYSLDVCVNVQRRAVFYYVDYMFVCVFASSTSKLETSKITCQTICVITRNINAEALIQSVKIQAITRESIFIFITSQF